MFDHENALDPSYLERILGCALIDIMGKKELVKRGTTSKYVWVEKPKLYYFQPNTGEQTFRYTHRLLASLPDKLEWQNKWYQVFEKDPKLPNQFQKDGKFWIPDPDNGRVQAVFIYDSLVTMTPESRMEDDEKSPIAKTARLFSDQVPIVRPLLGRKRCLIVATNQERTNPMAMMSAPNYEPAGDTVKYASDIRIRISTCAISNIGAGKGQIMEEKCWTGNGVDKYRVSKIKTTKNKCFSPFRECFVRLWFENNGQPGHGIDPVWDTYEYLRLTGQISYKMGKYTLTIPGAFDGKKVDWLGFKQIILDPNRNRIKSMLGINADTPDDDVNLCMLCKRQIQDDTAFQKYFDALSGALGRCSDCIYRNEEKCQVMASVNQGCPNFQKGDPGDNEQSCDYEQNTGEVEDDDDQDSEDGNQAGLIPPESSEYENE